MISCYECDEGVECQMMNNLNISYFHNNKRKYEMPAKESVAPIFIFFIKKINNNPINIISSKSESHQAIY